MRPVPTPLRSARSLNVSWSTITTSFVGVAVVLAVVGLVRRRGDERDRWRRLVRRAHRRLDRHVLVIRRAERRRGERDGELGRRRLADAGEHRVVIRRPEAVGAVHRRRVELGVVVEHDRLVGVDVVLVGAAERGGERRAGQRVVERAGLSLEDVRVRLARRRSWRRGSCSRPASMRAIGSSFA